MAQQELGTHVDSFVAGLGRARSASADVIMISELVDDELIDEVLDTAYVHCMLLAAVSWRGAAGTIGRLCAGPDEQARERRRHTLAGAIVAVLYQELCPRKDADGLVAAREFLFVTPAISNLIRENRLDRLDAAIKTGGKYGMQLLDDHLMRLVDEQVILGEDALERSRFPAEFQAARERKIRGEPPGPPTDPGLDPLPVRPKTPPPGLSGHSDPGPN